MSRFHIPPPTPQAPYPRELEADYRGAKPLITFLWLLGIGPWRHAGFLALYALKQLPVLLLPIVVAESIRVAGGDPSSAWPHLGWVYGGYLALILLNVPLHILYVRFYSRVSRGMELRVRAALVRRIQHLSMRFHSERESGRLQSKVLRDVEELIRLADIYFQAALGAFLSAVFAVGWALAQEPWIALGYVVVTPLTVGLIQLFRGAMHRRNDDLRREVESMSQRMSEMIEMVPVTRAHGLEETEIATMQALLEHVRGRGYRVDEINAFFGSSAFVILMSSIAGVAAVATWMVLAGTATLDKIALYSALFQMVLGAVNTLVAFIPQFSKSMAAIRSVGEVLESPDVEMNAGRAPVTQVEGRIAFCNVTFRYPGQIVPAVKDFSLNVNPGACVAFVGESGGGKSTLMQLAIGFLRPQHGEILLDGRSMEELDMRTWRRHIAMVPQQTILFSGTVLENITYGFRSYDRREVWKAVDAARLRETIENLPEGLETRVGENGLKLSGGQRQRLAIARALIRNPRVIILDEATSALDVVSEKDVQAAIDNLIEGRTTFIVAHRLSTIRQAALVVVMEGGEMVECGPPDELQARGGTFSRLKSLQS